MPGGWARRARTVVAVFLLVMIGAVVCIEAFVWLLPQDFSRRHTGLYGNAVAFSFFTRVFQMYVGFGVVLASLIVLWMRWWRSALLALVCGGAILFPFARDYLPKSKQAVAGPTVRIMAMNLYFMNRDADAIVRAIDDANPDIIVMPEMTSWSGYEVVGKRLGDRYPYRDLYEPAAGAAPIISRVPFKREPSVLATPDGKYRQPLVFSLGGREFTMYGVHLVSPGHRWLVQLNRIQVEMLADIRKTDSRPIVIAGDFNFTQLTPNYEYLESLGFRSSHQLAGYGVGNTWGPKWSWMNALPGVRIDHILLTPELTAVTHRVGLDDGSDHRPVIADIGFAATPATGAN